MLNWQLYISSARPGLWAPASSLVRSPAVSLQNQPAAPGEPSVLLRLLFSLLTHIHPAWSACQTLRLPPSICVPLSFPPPPLPHLFLRSTGLVKVSQSPVAPLYRLHCFLFKWRLLSCKYPCKDRPGCSSSSSSSTFCLVISVLLWTPISGHVYYLVPVSLSGQMSLTTTSGGTGNVSLKSKADKKKTLPEVLGQFDDSCHPVVCP